MKMIFTVTETNNLLKALKIAVRAAKEVSTDSEFKTIMNAYNYLNNKQFTDNRSKTQVDGEFLASFAADCKKYGSD